MRVSGYKETRFLGFFSLNLLDSYRLTSVVDHLKGKTIKLLSKTMDFSFMPLHFSFFTNFCTKDIFIVRDVLDLVELSTLPKMQ